MSLQRGRNRRLNLGRANWACVWLIVFVLSGCSTLKRVAWSGKRRANDRVVLPFLKNSPNECYFLDEFMPAPNNLVTGRSGSLNLRYYTYNLATYKEWPKHRIILSFYSTDLQCWSLFEEFYAATDGDPDA